MPKRGSLWQRLEPKAAEYEEKATHTTGKDLFEALGQIVDRGGSDEESYARWERAAASLGTDEGVDAFLTLITRKFSARVDTPIIFEIPRGKEPFVKEWQVRLILQTLICTPKKLFRAGGVRKILLYEGSEVKGGVTAAVTAEGTIVTENSAYHNRVVRIFPGLFELRPRTVLSVSAHEFGHALFQHYLENVDAPRHRDLTRCWRILKVNEGAALCGVGLERVGNAQARKSYQAGQLREFLAEIYMLYVVHDTYLRGHVDMQNGYLKDTWEEVWGILKEILGPPISESGESPREYKALRQ